jgi:hypothetical protein
MYSRMRPTGSAHGTENRPSMFWRICGPRPSWNRPSLRFARSQACNANSIGLRTNASVIEVRTVSFVVLSSASSATDIESCNVSGTCSASKPRASTRRAYAPVAPSGSLSLIPAITCTNAHRRRVRCEDDDASAQQHGLGRRKGAHT